MSGAGGQGGAAPSGSGIWAAAGDAAQTQKRGFCRYFNVGMGFFRRKANPGAAARIPSVLCYNGGMSKPMSPEQFAVWIFKPEYAVFKGMFANLSCVNFAYANLTGATIHGDLAGAYFYKTKLNGANLFNTINGARTGNCSRGEHAPVTEFSLIEIDDATRLPANIIFTDKLERVRKTDENGKPLPAGE